MGLPLVLDQGTCRIYRISPDGFLGFCEKEGVSAAKDGMIITLVTEKVDEVVAKLRARGLVLEKEPAFNPTFNIYHAFFSRPEWSSCRGPAIRRSSVAQASFEALAVETRF